MTRKDSDQEQLVFLAADHQPIPSQPYEIDHDTSASETVLVAILADIVIRICVVQPEQQSAPQRRAA
jgi:hypothetical protein